MSPLSVCTTLVSCCLLLLAPALYWSLFDVDGAGRLRFLYSPGLSLHSLVVRIGLSLLLYIIVTLAFSSGYSDNDENQYEDLPAPRFMGPTTSGNTSSLSISSSTHIRRDNTTDDANSFIYAAAAEGEDKEEEEEEGEEETGWSSSCGVEEDILGDSEDDRDNEGSVGSSEDSERENESNAKGSEEIGWSSDSERAGEEWSDSDDENQGESWHISDAQREAGMWDKASSEPSPSQLRTTTDLHPTALQDFDIDEPDKDDVPKAKRSDVSDFVRSLRSPLPPLRFEVPDHIDISFDAEYVDADVFGGGCRPNPIHLRAEARRRALIYRISNARALGLPDGGAVAQQNQVDVGSSELGQTGGGWSDEEHDRSQEGIGMRLAGELGEYRDSPSKSSEGSEESGYASERLAGELGEYRDSPSKSSEGSEESGYASDYISSDGDSDYVGSSGRYRGGRAHARNADLSQLGVPRRSRRLRGQNPHT